MEKLKYLTEYYNSYDEDGRLISKHGQVEFITTVNYIDKYLKKGMSVLEVGAGTGRYSLTIAEKGFQKWNIIEGIQNGIVDKDTFKCLSNPSLLFEMHRKDEIYEKMFKTYLRYHFSICERTDLIGMTHHSLDIFRK